MPTSTSWDCTKFHNTINILILLLLELHLVLGRESKFSNCTVEQTLSFIRRLLTFIKLNQRRVWFVVAPISRLPWFYWRHHLNRYEKKRSTLGEFRTVNWFPWRSKGYWHVTSHVFVSRTVRLRTCERARARCQRRRVITPAASTVLWTYIGINCRTLCRDIFFLRHYQYVLDTATSTVFHT